MFLHYHRNTGTFKLGETLASHLLHPPAQNRVNSDLRLGLPGLCSIKSWKLPVMDVPQSLWETKSRAQGLLRPVVKFFCLYMVLAPYFYLWSLSFTLSKVQKISLSFWKLCRLISLYSLGTKLLPFLKIGAMLHFWSLSKSSSISISL